MNKNLILVDRSRSTTDWECERRRYLNYELDGKGIVSEYEPIELFIGIVLHDSLADIARSHPDVDIDLIARDAAQKMADFLMKLDSSEKGAYLALEQASLVEGIIRGFHRYQWPLLTKQYPKILAIEQEMSYEYGRLLWMAKPDLVAVDVNGEVVYLEYKSTGTKKEEWIASWDTAIQLHSTTRAIEAALHEKISHIVVIGLFKGYHSYGKQNSPFCYAYKRSANPPFTKEEIAYEYKAGLKRFPSWETAGGVKAWVDSMPESILANQFPQTPPIFVNDDMVEAFFAQRNIREQEIQMATSMLEHADAETKKDILNVAFPQKFSECTPAWGHECAYRRICHGSVPDPLKSGFKIRVAHHEIELEAHNDK